MHTDSDEFSGLCRLCLKPSAENMVNVCHFDDLIGLIAKVKLVKHQMIPHKVCQSCSSILIAAGMLRVNCVESNNYFKKFLESKDEEPLTAEAAEEWETQLEIEEYNANLKEESEDVKETEEGEEEEEEEEEEENIEMLRDVVVEPKKIIQTKLEESCRLCLTSFVKLPEENALYFMKDMVKKILTMKKFSSITQIIPNKLCDDCMGKLITANSIADKCRAAYEYFHSKDSIVITTETCWVCLKDFMEDFSICDMNCSTYSYMHYLATRNIGKEQPELVGDRKICMKCMVDLEVANAIRYKNWKTEKALEQRYGIKVKRTERDSDEDEAILLFAKPLNSPPIKSQNVDCQYCLKQFSSESHLRKHFDLEHIPPNSTHCLQCGLKLSNERSFRIHFMTVHMRFVEAICDICGNLYYSTNKLVKHRVIHFEDRNVSCTLCPAKFKRKENLKIHMRVHKNEENERKESHASLINTKHF